MQMKIWRTRKPNRQEGFDYSNPHSYFVTICAKDKFELFGKVIDAKIKLSAVGKIVRDAILRISILYPHVIIYSSVVMPNHIHMIIRICRGGNLPPEPPTLSQVVGHFKRSVSIEAGYSPWQKSFHDHIIRDEAGFNKISVYIENNVKTWRDDCFYPKRV